MVAACGLPTALSLCGLSYKARQRGAMNVLNLYIKTNSRKREHAERGGLVCVCVCV